MPSQTQVASSRRLRVFLCHSSGDKLAVHNLYWRLKACNVDPWVDKEKLLPGQDWDLEIQKAVRKSDVVLICLSSDFIIKVGYGQKEIKLALNTALEKPEGTIYLIPLKLEECELPERLKPFHAVNYFEEGDFDRLISALKHRSESLREKIEPIDCQEQVREFVTEQLLTTSPADIISYTVPLQNWDPTQALLDLRLPPTFLDVLFPPLQGLGFTLTEEEIWDEYTSIRRKYTMVQNKMGQRCALLYVPGWILENANPANVHAISIVGSAFPKGSVLIIFSDTTKLPAREVRKIMEVRCLDERQVRVIFIPWRDIEELMGMNAEGQEHWITDQLKFQEPFEGAKKSMSVQQMDGNDTESLVKILEKLPQLIDEPGRGGRTLLQSARLDEIVSEFVLTGTARSIAWGLVDQLKRRARLPEHPDSEVLGLLLCYMLTLGDLPQKDCESIKQIIRKYALVPPSRSL